MPTNLDFRIGLGVDHHRLVNAPSSAGFDLTLGGFKIPGTNLALEGNSDADVIIHALCNALSTALGGGSLGPVTEPLCQAGEKNSAVYLTIFLDQVAAANYQINNISISVEALQPKLEAHGKMIISSLAALLKVEPSQIGLAFTTGENLTACGRGEGIHAQVIVSLNKI